MLLLVIVRRVLLGLLRVPLDGLEVLWDRTIVTTIQISGIGYGDSLISLGQNGFGPALLSLQLGIRRRAWAAAPAKADNRRRSRTRESGQPQTPPHPRKRTTADAGAAAAAAARSPDRKRLPCIQVYSVMTPLADSSMRCLRLPRPVRVFFAFACVWTAFIAFLAFMAFKDQLSLSKVMTLERGHLRSLLSEEQ